MTTSKHYGQAASLPHLYNGNDQEGYTPIVTPRHITGQERRQYQGGKRANPESRNNLSGQVNQLIQRV